MRSRRALVRCVMAALFAVAPASASLVYYRDIGISGTGHGTVIQLLDFGNINGTVSGCVQGTVTGGVWSDVYGNCSITASDGITYTFGNNQTTNPSWKTQTVTPGTVASMDGTPGGIASPFDFAFIYNPAQNGSLVISQMVLTFYNPNTGSQIYAAALPAPGYTISVGGSGSGGSGFMFGLDWNQAIAAQQAIAGAGIAWSDVRVGLSATVSNHNSHSYFFVMDYDGLVQSPEPATLVLIGSALGGLGLLRRRRPS